MRALQRILPLFRPIVHIILALEGRLRIISLICDESFVDEHPSFKYNSSTQKEG